MKNPLVQRLAKLEARELADSHYARNVLTITFEDHHGVIDPDTARCFDQAGNPFTYRREPQETADDFKLRVYASYAEHDKFDFTTPRKNPMRAVILYCDTPRETT